MTKFRAWAEYGPVAADKIELEFEAANIIVARSDFIAGLKWNYPSLWDRIGNHNVYIVEIE